MGTKQLRQVRSYGMGPTLSASPFPRLSQVRAAWLAFLQENEQLREEFEFIMNEIARLRQEMDDLRRVLLNNAN
ncbi:hypothetical protein MA16_Dca016637 [Dendrobium catenatum]|uniref:Uncharacterized protein n=1 Tax=Dendrobium catenatum TaxID=906689 RepID=A0A2I0WB62_9ASPA|nr:hypothetical protein MA16_Dca016637 [Dendrobium catenatum]